MAKKTAATKTTLAAVAEHGPETYAHCADGCGSKVNSEKSTFLQGHDQKLIAELSTRVTTGELTDFHRALLNLIGRDRTAQAGQFYYDESDDIMDRINAVSAGISARFSDGLSAKFTSAAMAKWDKSVRRDERAAAKAERLANPPKRVRKPRTKAATKTITEKVDETIAVETDTSKSTVGQPIENLRGTLVKAKIGRWTYDATVVGMNNAGKVSAVEYLNKKGEPVTTDRFTLVD